MKTPRRGGGGASKGKLNTMDTMLLETKPFRRPPQPPCVRTRPQAWKHLGAAAGARS